MTKYECAKQFLKLENLPPKQLDNLEVLERQILDIGIGFYPKKIVNLDNLSLKDAKEKLEELANQVHFLAKILLVTGADIHNFRMATLRRYLDVPPEMQIDDIISRLTTRDCDSVHEDTEDVALFGENQNTEKGKEEGKEEKSPHTPLKEKGQEESQKDSLSSARARTHVCPREEAPLFDGFFKVFWEEYPIGHKVAKKKCYAKLKSRYNQAKDKTAFVREVIEGLHKWLASPRWLEGVIVNPETFINQERWLDDPPKESSGMSRVSGVSQTANVKSNRAEGLW